MLMHCNDDVLSKVSTSLLVIKIIICIVYLNRLVKTANQRTQFQSSIIQSIRFLLKNQYESDLCFIFSLNIETNLDRTWN